MADEEVVRALVAFLFQRSGRPAMSENELANALSLDLNWYPPKAARGLVAGLVRAGWLERDEDGDLEATFDPKSMKVPLGFRPPGDLPGDLPPPGSYQAQAGSDARSANTSAAAPGAPAHQGGAHEDASLAEAGAAPADAPPARRSTDMDADDDGDPPEHLLGVLLERLETATGEPAATWMQRMEQVVQRTADVVTPEVALLIAAAKQGVDVAPWLEEVRVGAFPVS